jgi:hypothetical protein
MYKIENRKKIPNVCSLHDVLSVPIKTAHNCIGCNLADLTNAFGEVLRGLCNCKDLQASFSTYFMWLNVFVERYDFMMNYLGVPEPYRSREFPIFATIKHWANFQKHPKAFLFVHHPAFSCHAAGIAYGFKNQISIDQKFVDKYYKGGKHNDALPNQLINAKSVVVEYPDPREIIQDFCIQSQKFIRLVAENPIYQQLLTEKSTVMDFFDEEDES